MSQFQKQLRKLVDEHGVGKAAKMLSTNRESLARLIAGIEVKPVTLAAVTAALASIPTPADPPHW